MTKLSKGEVLMLNIGSMCTGARVLAVKHDLAKLQLTSPGMCAERGRGRGGGGGRYCSLSLRQWKMIVMICSRHRHVWAATDSLFVVVSGATKRQGFLVRHSVTSASQVHGVCCWMFDRHCAESPMFCTVQLAELHPACEAFAFYRCLHWRSHYTDCCLTSHLSLCVHSVHQGG